MGKNNFLGNKADYIGNAYSNRCKNLYGFQDKSGKMEPKVTNTQNSSLFISSLICIQSFPLKFLSEVFIPIDFM
jgi:hypothetical protein